MKTPAYAIVIACLLTPSTWAQTLIHTIGGPHAWNDDNNWGPNPPQPFPNDPGDAAVLLSPAGNLLIDLGQEITIGSLEVMKPIGANTASTTITGSATKTLTMSGGTSSLINRFSSAATGITTVAAPVIFDSTFNVTQESNEILQFTQPLSGLGGLAVARSGSGSGGRVVVLGAANDYQGAATSFTGSAADDWLVVRLAHVDAIPTTTNLSLGNSAVIELAAGDFTRSPGPGAGQIQFTGGGRNGWSALGADRVVNLGGNVVPSTVVWGAGVGQANFGQLVLGVSTSTAMVDFQNSLDLNATGNRNIRSYDGTADIDGRISGVISGGGSITKIDDGVLSLAAANTYMGFTRIEGGTLRLDHQGALPGGNLQLGSGASLGIGADTTPGDPASDFARDLGTGAGQIQMINIGTGENQANAGFSSHGGNRSVVLNGGAMLTWGTGSFLSGGTGTVNRHLILSGDSADGTLEFKNPIFLNGADRTVVARNGTADIDGILSGAINGGGGSFSKAGPGTLVLSGENTYDGGTSIGEGRMLVNNTNGSGTGSGPVTVTAGMLGGTGSIAGTVTVESGAHIAPGASIESLDVGSLVLISGAILDFELGALGTSDLLNVTMADGLSINGGTINLFDAGGLRVGTYTLIDYAGSLIGSAVDAFLNQVPAGPAGFTYALSDSGSTIDLTVSSLATNDADFNGDGTIDTADYVLWRKFNPTIGTGTQETGDANGDTNVDGLDYDIWVETFAEPSPGSGRVGAGGVPEPVTLTLLSIAVLFALRRSSGWVAA